MDPISLRKVKYKSVLMEEIEGRWYDFQAWDGYIRMLLDQGHTDSVFREMRFLSEQPPLDLFALEVMGGIVRSQEKRSLIHTLIAEKQNANRDYCIEITEQLITAWRRECISISDYEELFDRLSRLAEDRRTRFFAYLMLTRLHFLKGDFSATADLASLLTQKYADCAEAWLFRIISEKKLGYNFEMLSSTTAYGRLRGKLLQKASNNLCLMVTQRRKPKTDPSILTMAVLIRRPPKRLRIISDPADYVFDCVHCGKCCEGNIPVTKNEARAISDHTGVSMKTFAIERSLDVWTFQTRFGICYWRDRISKKCRIYSIRPEVCRTYPEYHVSYFGKNVRVLNLCPGTKQAISGSLVWPE